MSHLATLLTYPRVAKPLVGISRVPTPPRAKLNVKAQNWGIHQSPLWRFAKPSPQFFRPSSSPGRLLKNRTSVLSHTVARERELLVVQFERVTTFIVREDYIMSSLRGNRFTCSVPPRVTAVLTVMGAG